MKLPLLHLSLLAACAFAGCMTCPQTYDPRLAGRLFSSRDFLPDSYHEPDLASVHAPHIGVRVDDTSGNLAIDVCSLHWDWRRITILNDLCSLIDNTGRRYRLAPLESNSYANQHPGDSRFIAYRTYALEPLPSSRRHTAYSAPHTLRIVYTEDGHRYIAERTFAATYPLVDFFRFVSLFSQEP